MLVGGGRQGPSPIPFIAGRLMRGICQIIYRFTSDKWDG
jgi:hypothetical protein